MWAPNPAICRKESHYAQAALHLAKTEHGELLPLRANGQAQEAGVGNAKYIYMLISAYNLAGMVFHQTMPFFLSAMKAVMLLRKVACGPCSALGN